LATFVAMSLNPFEAFEPVRHGHGGLPTGGRYTNRQEAAKTSTP